MPEPEEFTPRRHPYNVPDAAPGMEDLLDHAYVLDDLERDLFAEPAKRRAMAGSLRTLEQRRTPHLSEHLAWLLDREADALTAYDLYRAVLIVHPSPWRIALWQQGLALTTPFDLLRRAILDDMLADANFDPGDETDMAILGRLADDRPEDRAFRLAVEATDEATSSFCHRRIVPLLDPETNLPEKTAALRVLNFLSGDVYDATIAEALQALFLTERHPGTSERTARILSRRSGGPCNLALLAVLIEGHHVHERPAAAEAMRSVLYGVEGFLRDDVTARDANPDGLSACLLDAFSGQRARVDEAVIVAAIMALSLDRTRPMAALSASAWLARCRGSRDGVTALALDFAGDDSNPPAQALVIRVLGRQAGALKPERDRLRDLAIAPGTAADVRRAVFLVMADTRRSGMGIGMKEVIDLFLAYLQHPGFDYAAYALFTSDLQSVEGHYIARLSASFDHIPDEAGRLAAMDLIEASFGWGFDPVFDPWRTETTALLLASLDRVHEEDLHARVFWNMLNEVILPEPHRAHFAAGLRDRLARLPYSGKTRSSIEGWLQDNDAHGIETKT